MILTFLHLFYHLVGQPIPKTLTSRTWTSSSRALRLQSINSVFVVHVETNPTCPVKPSKTSSLPPNASVWDAPTSDLNSFLENNKKLDVV